MRNGYGGLAWLVWLAKVHEVGCGSKCEDGPSWISIRVDGSQFAKSLGRAFGPMRLRREQLVEAELVLHAMASDRQRAAKPDDLDKMAQETIEEARMVLPGIQTLFGFQLIAVFNNRFAELPDLDRGLHLAALVLVAVSIALIMTPAAYHRIVEQRTVSEFFIRLASWLIAGAMVPLMLAISLEVYLVSELVLDRARISITIATVLSVLLAGLWFAFPFIARRQ